MPQNLIILGAGASKAENAPLQRELISSYWNAESPLWLAPDGFVEEDVLLVYERLFGVDPRDDEAMQPTLKEVLGLLETAISRGERFPLAPLEPDGGSAPDREIDYSPAHLRQQILRLIPLSIDRALFDPGTSLHDELLTNLSTTDTLPSVGFLSLNYDLLLDHAIMRRAPTNEPDYALDFYDEPPPPPRLSRAPPDEPGSIPLLKPHGSLNWVHCPTCGRLHLTKFRKGAADVALGETLECPVCGWPLEALLLPPTYFKDDSNVHLARVARATQLELEDASRLVFSGYSMPEADLMIKYLLKRAELLRGGFDEVIVLNDYDGKGKDSRRAEAQRFKRFFHKDTDVRYERAGFEALVERPAEFLA